MYTLTFAFLLICFPAVLASTVGRGDLCTADPNNCTPPLSCVGAPARKPRCYMKKAVNMQCGKDPFWVCEDGLQCIDGLCKNPIWRTELCDKSYHADSACIEPLSCVGPVGKKRCYEKKPRGMRCGVDPFWVCEDGLDCNYNVCTKLLEQKERCDGPGAANSICRSPLSCVGPVGKKRCYMEKNQGGRCGVDPFWVCESWLKCKGGRCVNVLGRAEKCEEPFTMCKRPLSCVGPTGKMRCYKKKALGMTCGADPFWVCADGLKCVHQICKTA